MSYVPGCSADVFISYAHHDNRDGWVTRLKEKLAEKLNPFLAGRAEVWFDDRIAPGTYFQQEIQQKLKNTKIFVAAISPAYLASENCMTHELEWFQNQGGTDIIQLVKVPLDKGQEVPVPAADFVSLYDKNDFHVLQGEALEKLLDEVVAAIVKRLREVWESRPKIYVARLSDGDWKARWQKLKDRLHEEGFALLPKDVVLARVKDSSLREWLEQARLSVHVEGLQNDFLAQRQMDIAKQIGKPMLLLRKPPFEDDLGEVIAEVQKLLEAHRKPALYFIYDFYSDGSRVADWIQLIGPRSGCDVFLPEAGEKYHKFRLRVSDGVLLFRSEAPDGWLESQEQTLLQAAALRGSVPVAEAKYITRKVNGSLAGVTTRHGQRRELIIERTGEPNVDDLEPFLSDLRKLVQARAAVGSA
jgi:TIR domain